MKKEKEDQTLKDEHCDCQHNNCDCNCEDDCNCGDECDCGCNCECESNEHCDCDNCECTSKDEQINEYLNMARKVQAEFDNYRKRSAIVLDSARENGIFETVRVFLPAIDAFKKAKTMIKDQSTLEGVEMVEKELYSSLEKLGIEPIKALGEKLDPKLHNVVAVLENNNVEDDIIIEEYLQGFKTKDKVIRYSQVIVNKKGE